MYSSCCRFNHSRAHCNVRCCTIWTLNACVSESWPGASKVARKLQLPHPQSDMIASKLLLHKDSYSHRVWPQHKAGQKLHFRAQRILSSLLCLFPPHLYHRSIVAPLPHKRPMCVGIPFYMCIFLTWRARQQTGVHWLCLFHPHTVIGMLLRAESVSVWVWGRSTAPREPIAGHHCEAGGGGAVGLLESRGGILCETEPSRLTETPHSCEATAPLTSCTRRFFKPTLCVF